MWPFTPMKIHIHSHQHGDPAVAELMCLVRKVRANQEQIMDAITTFAARVNQKFDALGVSIDGVVADVNFLKDAVARLQASEGVLSPEDQATLDAVEGRLDGMATKVADLDAATDSAAVPTP